MFEMSSPPLAIAECGLCGEFGFIPTTYGAKETLEKLEWGRKEWDTPDIGLSPRK